MTTLRVALLAPIANSLYARSVAWLAANEPGLELVGAVVRTPFTLSRIRGELRRDGPRLVEKVRDKLVLAEPADAGDDQETLLAFARRAGVPGRTLRDVCPRVITVDDHNDDASLAFLRAARPDVTAFTGGGMIRRALLGIPRMGVLNCHMGQLPRYRGTDVVEWPMVEGALDSLGLTVHFMDEGLDTGAILLDDPYELRPGDTIAAIRRRLSSRMPAVMMAALRGLRDEALTPAPQREADGRQYFVMHPRLVALAAEKLRRRTGG